MTDYEMLFLIIFTDLELCSNKFEEICCVTWFLKYVEDRDLEHFYISAYLFGQNHLETVTSDYFKMPL